ncbi:alcohol dehydrogenase catalytic domain-containing protein [Paeniglutamicibacter sp. MACA_103]|uniref:alcohol dehydrogenase catalytic domain-containing protein n=1 Tax=Paeniglutamicibacter sp. MACA_103 TaxID=3377337 RepID=UPI0038955BF8
MTEYRSARGAVVFAAGGPVEIHDIQVPEPEDTEAMIAVDACGLCHSDLHYIDGTSGTDFPYLLGHEIVGRIVAVGAAATVAVGTRVVVALLAPCGQCGQCARGRRTSCTRKVRKARPALLASGQELTPVLGAGGLADYVTVDEQHIVTVPAWFPVEQAALLGCGVPTGYGAVMNTAGVRAGDSVAVIGAGGVGLAAMAAARFARASRIAAIDVSAQKLEESVHFGATETYRAGADDLPTGFDIVVDAVGGAATLRNAVDIAGEGGHIVIPGAPKLTEQADFPMRTAFMKRLSIEYSHWGDCDPQRDIASLSTLALTGGLPLERYVSEVIDFAHTAQGYERMRAGTVLRSVVRISA